MLHGLYQGIFNGLASGLIYILVALGLTLLFSILGILNFAHGEIYMLGAYVVYYACVAAHINFFLSLLLSAFALGILGILLERFVFRRIRGDMEPAVLAAIGLTVLLQTVAVIAFGTYLKYIPSIFPGILKLGGLRLSKDRLLVMGIALVFTTALLLVINKTKIGKAMLAISHDAEAAALQGINVNRISALTMGIGCALAAVAGGLMGSLLQLAPYMGTFAMTKGIAVIILGGIGSVPGAVIGGFILGLVDGLAPLFTSGTIAAIIGFSVIVLILLIKPKGLLGHD
ncbi:MAG TPA: branched-chain amino acid ABC transporter permease [Syntrophorhabdales bacterium]|nr:branched-chain amino acid ABC transporter permease [Syntrophorhabdales bacterium]